MGQMASDMWVLVMTNVIQDPESTDREKELATLCAELIEEGKDSYKVQRWLRKRSSFAAERTA